MSAKDGRSNSTSRGSGGSLVAVNRPAAVLVVFTVVLSTLAGEHPASATEAEEHLRDRIIQAAEKGRKLTFFLDMMGNKTRARVSLASGDGLTVRVMGRPLDIEWSTLTPEAFARIAASAIDKNSAQDQFSLGRYCTAAGLAEQGEEALRLAYELDPSLKSSTSSTESNGEYGADSDPPAAPASNQEATAMAQPEPAPQNTPEVPLPEGALRVPLFVREHAGIGRSAWPVTTGIPFADGTLPAAAIARGMYRMVDSSGAEVPSQASVASMWGKFPQGPNGYAKWVHVTFPVSVGGRGNSTYYLEAGKGIVNGTPPGVKIEPSGRGVAVSTGPLRFTAGTNGMNLLDSVWLDTDGDGSFSEDERIIVSRAEGNMYVEYTDGKGFTASDSRYKVEVEEAGPFRAVIRVSAAYDEVFHSVLRIYAYAGRSFLRIQDTLVHGPLNQGLHAYTSIGRTRLIEHSLFLPMSLAEGAKAVFGGAQSVGLGEAWLEQNVNHHFQPGGGGFRFELKSPGGVITRGAQAPGWVDVSDGRWGVTAATRYFRQLFPKRIRASRNGLKLELWAKNARLQPNGADTHYQGMARTHDILLAFHAGGFTSTCETLANSHLHEVFAVTTPEIYCISRAYGRHPIPPLKHGGIDSNVYRIVGKDGSSGFPAWRQKGDEWGYFNFGDSMLGPYWSCLEYDSPWGLLQNFYRLGDPDILREASLLCRGAYDMLFRHHFGPSTSMYPQCSHDKQERHFGGGDSHGHTKGTDPGHVFISGLVNYWYLTGDKRAGDVIFRAFPIYLADDKERISCGGTWRYCGGYLMDIFCHAYELTWEKRYIDRMEWMCNRVFRDTPTRHPDGVWWGGSEGNYSCQPWLGDSVVHGYTGYLDLNPGTQYRKDIEEGVVAVADFVDKHAFARDRRAIHQGLSKQSREGGPYSPSGQFYGGFMCMMSSFTMCKAYELTGNPRYLEVAKELFQNGLQGWDSNGAKSAGEAMIYAAQSLYYVSGGRVDPPRVNR